MELYGTARGSPSNGRDDGVTNKPFSVNIGWELENVKNRAPEYTIQLISMITYAIIPMIDQQHQHQL